MEKVILCHNLLFRALQRSVHVSIDPVNVPRHLSVNSRVGWYSAGFDRPGHDPDLLAVHKKGAARVTLNTAFFSKYEFLK
jgi:hypothetical protein